jgi:pyoverdine/dityrosine biosynthesis protein Dit1
MPQVLKDEAIYVIGIPGYTVIIFSGGHFFGYPGRFLLINTVMNEESYSYFKKNQKNGVYGIIKRELKY